MTSDDKVEKVGGVDGGNENLLTIIKLKNLIKSKKLNLAKSKNEKMKRLDFIKANSFEIGFLTSKIKKAFIYL